MTLQQLRKELKELKEEAANKPNLWMFFKSNEEELKAREEMKKEISELEEKMRYYRDAGVFDDEEGKEDNSINLNWESCNIPTLTVDLIQRWKNRANSTIEESIQLYRDIGFYSPE